MVRGHGRSPPSGPRACLGGARCSRCARPYCRMSRAFAKGVVGPSTSHNARGQSLVVPN
ncbi:hypothetical protein SHJG_5022 [Streptomyces hygroscopicus subsp. jinggangensis 5008]|nr:hypothetical protein SHJG_5022 [Streptomyces hygroscopicus subsp. jinggangensis 5008]AGF64448.1 hypothetical protein SHJGH_4785 [Streptomyces hygroscopicus subsp. jinggangensis TL01]